MCHLKLLDAFQFGLGLDDRLEVQVILETVDLLEALREAVDEFLAILNHGRAPLQVNALAGELVAVLQEVLQLLILHVEIVKQEVLVLDDCDEVVEAHALLIELFNIILDKVVDLMNTLDAKVLLELFDTLLCYLEIVHVQIQVIIVLLRLLEVD